MGTELLQHQLDRELREEHDISFSEYEILVRLSEAEDGRMRMAILADAMSHSRSRVTHTIARMERADLVVREASRADGRGVEAVMTERGPTRPDRGRADPRPRRARAPRRPGLQAGLRRPRAHLRRGQRPAAAGPSPTRPTSADAGAPAATLSRGSGGGASRGADGRPRHRGARSCSPRRTRSCPRTRTTSPSSSSSPSQARMWVATRSRNHRSCEVTTAQPGYSSSASSSEDSVSTSRSLVGSSSSSMLPPIFRVSARLSRLRSPPESTPAFFCWSGPLKPNEAT